MARSYADILTYEISSKRVTQAISYQIMPISATIDTAAAVADDDVI